MQNTPPVQNQTQSTPTSQSTNPTPTISTPSKQAHKTKKTWLLISLIVLLLSSTGGLGYKYYEAQQQLDKQTQPVSQPSPKLVDSSSSPTTSPVAEADPTENWKTYKDSQIGFQFKYPSTYTLGKLGEDTPLLNHNIYWDVSRYSYKECRGDCPIVDSTKEITIGDKQATKIYGWVGSVGGNIPQSYIKYEIPINNSDYLSFTLWELPQDGDLMKYEQDRQVQSVSQQDEAVFDQILSTFEFTD
jgi:hypothetical protein